LIALHGKRVGMPKYVFCLFLKISSWACVQHSLTKKYVKNFSNMGDVGRRVQDGEQEEEGSGWGTGIQGSCIPVADSF